ncbi:MAG: ribonuclease III [Geminicoccaceae bacterium]
MTATRDSEPLETVQAIIDYRFRDERLLREALTHASATTSGSRGIKRSNERLEFLGDRVLGLLVAEMLIAAYPEDPEGALSRRQDLLVRKETLADIAQSLELGAALTLARGERQSGGRDKAGILADAMEAIIGAIFIDGGLDSARPLIERHWRNRAEALKVPPRDPKTALQEWAQARALGLPVYEAVSTTGPSHSPVFRVAVAVQDHERVVAEGGSKREAEKAAARLFLERLEDR